MTDNEQLIASMRPQRNAAENPAHHFHFYARPNRFNEAAA